MPVRLAVPKEIFSGRTPGCAGSQRSRTLYQTGALRVLVQKGAGKGAHFVDTAYEGKARLLDDAAALYAEADVVFKVQPPALDELDLMRDGIVIVGFLQPHRYPDMVHKLCDKKITSLPWNCCPVFPVPNPWMPCPHKPPSPAIKSR